MDPFKEQCLNWNNSASTYDNTTVETPSSDHPKCKDLVVAYGRWSFTRIGGPLPRRGPGTSTLWQIIYCMQFLSYTLSISMLSLKLFVYSKWYSARSQHKDHRRCQVVAYKRLKAMKNHQTFRPKKWSRQPTGGMVVYQRFQL